MKVQTNPEPVELGSLGEMLGFTVRLAQIRLFEAFYADFKDLGIGPGEASTLLVIHQNPGIRQGVLAAALKIKRSNMAKMIGSLNRRGLIERSTPSSDKRTIRLHLSTSGKALARRIGPRMGRHDERISKIFSASEMRSVTRLLKRVAFQSLPETL